MEEPRPTDRSRLLDRLRRDRFGDGALREPEELPLPAVATEAGPGLSARLDAEIREARESCDLLLIFRDGPRLFQAGNFVNVLSNGATARITRNQFEPSRTKPPAFVLINLPRADFSSLPAVLAQEIHCELFSPTLGRRYRFEKLSSLKYTAGVAGGLPPVPVVRVTSFPYRELTLSGDGEMSVRLRNLHLTHTILGGCLGEELARAMAGLGSTAFEVRYWVQHDGSPTGGALDFRGEDIECVWSGDQTRIAEELNHAVEVGLSFAR